MGPVGNGGAVKATGLAEWVLAGGTVPTAAIIPNHRVAVLPYVARLETLLPGPGVKLLQQVHRRTVLPSFNTDGV